ncbi:hypothetical protein K2X33_09080, partial [bacterium]|nr:hypothetical protein [bacterium]
VHQFLSFVSQGPEASLVESLARQPIWDVILQTRNPLHWLSVAGSQLFGVSPSFALLVLSNLFLLLFLWEAFQLFNRMVTTDISTLAAIFILLWPTSYELSLGSSLPLVGFFFLMALRQALEQVWWISGLAAAAVALIDPIALAALPAFAYVFWSVQRFLTPKEWGRNLAFFLVPMAIGGLLSGGSYSIVLESLGNSALLDLISLQTGGESLISHAYMGQTLALVFLFLGATGALFSNVNPLHRFLPLLVLLAFLVCTPYNAMASRVPIAGICMEGIASASSGMASRVVSLLMVLLGAYEVYMLFGA